MAKAATIDINDSEVERLFSKLKREAPQLALKLLDDTADDFLDYLQDEWLSRPGSGRVYPSATGSGTHRASAPGEPPAPDTTSYRESWRTGALGPLSRAVYTDDRRGPILEYGGGNILPRPHASPAALAYQRTFHRSIKEMARDIEQIRVL